MVRDVEEEFHLEIVQIFAQDNKQDMFDDDLDALMSMFDIHQENLIHQHHSMSMKENKMVLLIKKEIIQFNFKIG